MNLTIGPGQMEVCLRNARGAAISATNIYGKKIIRICRWCKKDFAILPSVLRKGKGNFCSQKCARNIQRKIHLEKCTVCGKKINRIPSQLKSGKKYFCSVQCRYKWQTGKPPKGMGLKGNKCPAWKGGITPISKLIRSSAIYNNWRQQCFIRDNFTCQKCRYKTGGNLEAHHKKPFSILLQEAKSYMPLLSVFDAAMLYTPLWNIDNGVTLCEKCHNKTKRLNQYAINYTT